ncbi:MAG: ATP-dependent DNA ligase [Candidatus Helarchaeota archaeon]
MDFLKCTLATIQGYKTKYLAERFKDQAEKSKEEDRIKLNRFFYGMKPVRVTVKGEPQSLEAVWELIKEDDMPIYISKKYDGYRVLIFRDKNKVKIISEDGTDHTRKFPNMVKELLKLKVEQFILDAEIECWINGEHQPREAVAAYVHRLGEVDDSNFIANVFTCLYYGKIGDLHRAFEEVRQEYLRKLGIGYSTLEIPDVKNHKLNEVPNIELEDYDFDKFKEICEELSHKPGSEGVVIKKHNAKYYLDVNSRNGWLKWHKAFLVVVEILDVHETKTKGVYNYTIGLTSKYSDYFEDVQDGKIVIGRTFNTDVKLKKGDRIIIEGEQMNLIIDNIKGKFDIGIWAPRIIDTTKRRTSNLVNALEEAYKNEVLVMKLITRKDEIKFIQPKNFKEVIRLLQSHFSEKIQEIDKYNPERLQTEQLRDDFRIALAWYSRLEQGEVISGITKAKVKRLLKQIMEELISRRNTTFHPEKMKPVSRKIFLEVLFEIADDFIELDRESILKIINRKRFELPPNTKLGLVIFGDRRNWLGAIHARTGYDWYLVCTFKIPKDLKAKDLDITKDYLTPSDPYMRLPDEDKRCKYVAQHHFRGRTCHTDPRFELVKNEVLIKFTLADLIKDTIKEPVLTLEQAKKIDAESEKYFKINWQTGEWKKRKRDSKLVNVEIAAVKAAPEPFEWLEFEGVVPPGKVGATKNYPGVFHIIDRGYVEYGAQKPWFHEYFLDGKVMNYRLVFRRIKNIWKALENEKFKSLDIPEDILEVLEFDYNKLYSEDELPFYRNEILEELEKLAEEVLPPSEGEFGRGEYGWLAIKPDDQEPYVLSKRAVDEGWMPPVGFSALPRYIRRQIPKEYRYWTVGNLEGALTVRNELVELIKKGEIQIEYERSKSKEIVCQVKGRFVYQYIYYKGPLVVRVSPSLRYWAIRYSVGNNHYAIILPNKIEDVVRFGGDEVYIRKEKEDYSNLHGYIPPNHPANETKNTEMFVEKLDSGGIIIYEDSVGIKKIEFKGNRVEGVFLFEKKGEAWFMKKVEKSPGSERG